MTPDPVTPQGSAEPETALDYAYAALDEAQRTIERLTADKDRLTFDLAEARAAAQQAADAGLRERVLELEAALADIGLRIERETREGYISIPLGGALIRKVEAAGIDVPDLSHQEALAEPAETKTEPLNRRGFGAFADDDPEWEEPRAEPLPGLPAAENVAHKARVNTIALAMAQERDLPNGREAVVTATDIRNAQWVVEHMKWPEPLPGLPEIDVARLAAAIRATDYAIVDLRTHSQVLAQMAAPHIAAAYHRAAATPESR